MRIQIPRPLGRLGRFEEHVLLALVRLGENAYGVPIRREIAELTGRDVSFGAVYTALDRLERKGYVTSWVGDSTPERGGRAKRYFQIESPGITAIERIPSMTTPDKDMGKVTRGERLSIVDMLGTRSDRLHTDEGVL